MASNITQPIVLLQRFYNILAFPWNRLWIRQYRNLLLKRKKEKRENKNKTKKEEKKNTHPKSFCRGNIKVTALDELPSLHCHDILSLCLIARQVFPTLVYTMLVFFFFFFYSQDLQGMKRIPLISRRQLRRLPALPSLIFSVQDWSDLPWFHSSQLSLVWVYFCISDKPGMCSSSPCKGVSADPLITEPFSKLRQVGVNA